MVLSAYFTVEFFPYLGVQSWVYGVNRRGLKILFITDIVSVFREDVCVSVL